jgi:hypothetical protein
MASAGIARRSLGTKCLGSYSQFVFADHAADLLEGRQRLALGVQCLAAPPGTRVPAELGIERVVR